MGRGVGFGRAFQILIFLSFFFPFKIISHNNSSSNTLCIDIERDALLKFKKELQDPSNRLSSWISEVDCCKWVGIQCDGLTGHIKELNLSSTSFDPFQTTDELILFQNFKLGGKLSNSILNLKHISYIDLSYNDFQGLIPHQVGNLSNLQRLHLGGKLPNSIGSLINLRSLHLRNNSLFGKIPHSLKECSMLSMLDLGLNSFEGNIPTWIGTSLTSLVALSLRSNQLIGLIPHELCHLSFLQIMDIGNNNFIGSIPYCFGNFTAMSTTNPWWKWKFNSITFIQNFEEDLLPENTYVITKGEEFQYNKILGLMKSMDLSNNNLSGEIPQEITNLFGLKSLNLSGNHLRGRIPQQIGSMTDMESLDLSRNQLSGPIPPSISNLTFLGRLNLSYNDLMGPIPTSTQLQSFDPSSFVGNELCGLPLGNSCSWEKTTENKEKEEAKEGDENYIDKWFYLSVGIGFVVGFWGIWGPLLVSTTWRHTYYRKFSSFCHFLI